MAYTFQSFAVGEVLTSTKMNQIEINVRDHVHGVSSVVGSGHLLTNAVLTTPTINTTASVGGTWTAAAAWTLPALTLGGTVTVNGQSLSGTFGSNIQVPNLYAFVGRNVAANGNAALFGAAGDTDFGSAGNNAVLGVVAGGSVLIGTLTATRYLTIDPTAITTGSGITSLNLSAGNPSLTIGTGTLTAGAGNFSGIISAAAATTTGSAAGDVVLKWGRSVLYANNAGTDTIRLIQAISDTAITIGQATHTVTLPGQLVSGSVSGALGSLALKGTTSGTATMTVDATVTKVTLDKPFDMGANALTCGAITASGILSATNVYTAKGTTLVDSATATTIFAATTKGMYIVQALIDGGAGTTHDAAVITSNNGSTVLLSFRGGGSTVTLSVSGTNVQVTQTSGSQTTVTWSYLRINYD